MEMIYWAAKVMLLGGMMGSGWKKGEKIGEYQERVMELRIENQNVSGRQKEICSDLLREVRYELERFLVSSNEMLVMKYDLTILTDQRYVNPSERDIYTQNVLDEDGLLADACEKLGMKVHRTNWDDPEMDWTDTRFAIFRTTWDYFERFPAFSKWLDVVQTKTTLINSKELIHWNLDKHYLLELERKGVRIPATMYLKTGDTASLMDIVEQSGWSKCILKPAVSGAARHTYKFDASNVVKYEGIYQKLIAKESMMLQEYQEQITTKGEVSYMVFGGKYSHAILKKAKAGDFRVQDDFGGTLHEYRPTAEEIAFAEHALAQCPELPVYARVDIFWNNQNELVLGELELIEPELWFRECATAAPACAEAIQKYLKEN